MNKKLIAIIVAIIVVVGLFLFYTEQQGGVSKLFETKTESEYSDAPLAPDALPGMWRSIEDPSFTRTIFENGGYVDAYAGEDLSINGPWMTFTDETAPLGFPYTAQSGVTYLQLIDESGPLYFSIAELTEESLVLIYLDRGGVLEFERVVE